MIYCVTGDLDRTDLKILRELQRDGRLPVIALADKVSLSATACLRRVKKLEESGVIEGYTARLNSEKLGLQIQAFIQVRIERQSKDVAESFEDAVRRLPEIRACYVMTGDLDFLLHVFVADLKAFSDFTMHTLIGLPGVKDIRSSLVLESIKPDEGFGWRTAK